MGRICQIRFVNDPRLLGFYGLQSFSFKPLKAELMWRYRLIERLVKSSKCLMMWVINCQLVYSFDALCPWIAASLVLEF